MTTYPIGYGNDLVSIDQLRDRHEAKMHPEYARRIFACIAAADGLVGIGNGWRSAQTQAENHRRSPNTFAPPGLSFHESHRFGSGVEAYLAVDTVGRDARHDEAWSWMRDNAGRFGLRTFWNVNGEPWHTQCTDLANGVTSWKAAGSPDPGRFTLPGEVPGDHEEVTVARLASPGDVVDFGLYPFNDDKPAVGLGWHGDLVHYVQRVIFHRAGGNIDVDGDFGPATERRVRDLQAFVKLAATGVIDWGGTWQVIDLLAGNERAPAPGGGDHRAIDHGLYWIRRGDSPWAVAERVYGDGTKSSLLEPTDPPEPGFLRAEHAITLPGLTGRTTKVRAGDRPWALVARLYPDSNPAERLDRFHTLNGGADRTLRPGDVVFLDDTVGHA